MRGCEMTKSIQFSVVAVVVICLSSFSFQSYAQDAGGLEEIVVTAQKRSESMQDVPISIQVFSADEIERLNIRNTIDLVRNVPNMIGINNVGLPQAASYFLRGVGQDESISSLDPAVGTFVDGVYISRQIANNARLYDVDSVEVLRGPQGTLYGRNTSGGAIRIITQKPHDHNEGFIDLAYGEYDTREVTGKANLAISDNLFLKVTAFYLDQSDGFLQNVTLNRDQWTQEATGARVQVLYSPSDRFEALLTYEHSDDDTGGIVGANALSACCSDDVYQVESGLVNTWASTNLDAYSLRATWDLDNMQVDLIMARRNLNHNFMNDYSDQALPAYIIPNDSDHMQESAELNFSGEGREGAVRWAAGASYYDDDNDVTFGDGLCLFGCAVEATFWRDMTNVTKTRAVYADVAFDINDQWTLTVGGRHTDDSRVMTVQQYLDVSPIKIRDRNQGNFLDRSGYIQIPGVTFGTADVVALGTPDRFDISEFTSRVVIEYNPTDSIMVYASVADSFKGGGWAARVTSAVDFKGLTPEFVDSREFGMKSQWLNDTLRFNITYFDSDYKDLQVTAIDQVSGAFVYSNKADASVDGIEAEFVYAPRDNLTVFANLGTLNGNYTDVRPGAEGLMTKELKRTPDLSYRLGVLYDQDTVNGEMNLSVVLNHEDEYYTNQNNTAYGLRPSADTWDLNVTYRPSDANWRLTAGCTNCADEERWNSTLDFGSLGFATQFQDLPRMWRVSFRYDY
jgi:iron complex outermembrane receptor protein